MRKALTVSRSVRSSWCWSLRRITRSQLSSSPTNRAQHAELVVRDSSPDFELTSKPSFMGSRNIVYLSDFFSKRAALIDGAGYGWIPYHFVRDDLDAGTLTLLKAESNRWTLSSTVDRPRGHELGRAGRLFVETLSPPLAGAECAQLAALPGVDVATIHGDVLRAVAIVQPQKP